MQGQGLIGLGMRMLQGGKDKTGYGDLYDSLGVTRGRSEDPAKLLAAAIAASKMGDDEDVTSTVVEDMQGLMGDEQRMFGDDTGKPTFREKYLGPFFDFFSGDDDFEVGSNTYAKGGLTESQTDFQNKRNFGIGSLIEQAYESGVDILPMLYNLLGVSGFEDGGRVEMQQGGMPMPALLGVSSGSTGTLPNYSMGYDPSAIPGPDYGTTAAPNYNYQAPQLTSLASPSINSSFDISSLLGGPDPFAVSYNPYVNATGTEDAYGQYGIGLDEDTIMDAFSDLDKYSLAAQEAKRKAAEEAAKKVVKVERGGGGGGSSPSAGGPTGPGGQSPGPQGQRGGTPD